MQELIISVVIPFYNGMKYFKQSLESALNQTLKPIEIIIVDDGSPVDSSQAIHALIQELNADIPIHFVKKANGGQGSARNYGVKLAKGTHIALLDQDDCWYPDHLEKLSTPFRNIENLGWSYSNLDEMKANGKIISNDVLKHQEDNHPKKTLLQILSRDAFIFPCAVLILKEALNQVGGFDENLRGYEDDDLFIRLFCAGWQNAYINESLSAWRIHEDNCSFSERMDRSRKIFISKLLEKFGHEIIENKVGSQDIIIPRFLKTIMRSYIHECIQNKNYKRCEIHRKDMNAYCEMLSKFPKWKWKFICILLKYPSIPYLVWNKILNYVPLPWKFVYRRIFQP
jgi:glycosyltransferase involved in cell wall biosynthesis